MKKLHKDYGTLVISLAEEVEAIGDALDMEMSTNQISDKKEDLVANASALLAAARTNLSLAGTYLKKASLRTNLKEVNSKLKQAGLREVGK